MHVSILEHTPAETKETSAGKEQPYNIDMEICSKDNEPNQLSGSAGN